MTFGRKHKKRLYHSRLLAETSKNAITLQVGRGGIRKASGGPRGSGDSGGSEAMKLKIKKAQNAIRRRIGHGSAFMINQAPRRW